MADPDNDHSYFTAIATALTIPAPGALAIYCGDAPRRRLAATIATARMPSSTTSGTALLGSPRRRPAASWSRWARAFSKCRGLGRASGGSRPPAAATWVIVGGESGRGARPMHLSWARSIKDQCHAAGVPVFVKQLGRTCVMDRGDAVQPCGLGAGWDALSPGDPLGVVTFRDSKGGDQIEWPIDMRVQEMPA